MLSKVTAKNVGNVFWDTLYIPGNNYVGNLTAELTN